MNDLGNLVPLSLFEEALRCMDTTWVLLGGSLDKLSPFLGDNIMNAIPQSYAVQYGSHQLHADLNSILCELKLSKIKNLVLWVH